MEALLGAPFLAMGAATSATLAALAGRLIPGRALRWAALLLVLGNPYRPLKSP